MLVFADHISPRLSYISHFVAQELYGQEAMFTTDKSVFHQYTGPKINYTANATGPNEVQIVPHGLLSETNITEQAITCSKKNDCTVFFQTEGCLGFDILAAAFYLISRYEEYLPHKQDMYGRYAHENALAFREGFLHQPLVNCWLQLLRDKMQERFPGIPLKKQSFRFIPTYDIDEAYSYRYKVWWRSAGAALKDLLKGNWKNWQQRRLVLDGKMADPFDAYNWMDDLHRPHATIRPHYFFLIPARTGKYDRNVLPSETAMQTLIRKHAEKYSVGIHPSWQSGDDPLLLKEEKERLETITQQKIISSRQHFIRLTLPDSYRKLINAGIKDDYSMGYGSINGFRASVASPFYWYDLGQEAVTHLRVHPFCYMEANSYYEQKFSPRQALQEMQQYYRAVKDVQGTLIMIWHNTFLGTDTKFEGWREVYRQMFEEIMKDQRTH